MFTSPVLFTTLILIFKDDRIGLQLRDNKPDILFSGCVSTFGGHVEAGESVETGLHRETKEELGLDIKNFTVQKLGEYDFVLFDQRSAKVISFFVENVDFDDIKVKEGFLCIINQDDNLDFLNMPAVTKRQLNDLKLRLKTKNLA